MAANQGILAPSVCRVNVTQRVPVLKSVIFVEGVFVTQGYVDFGVTAVNLATTLSLSVKNATVIQLAQWTIYVVLEDSVCATGTLLDLNATSVLQVITTIPAACLASALLLVPSTTPVSQQQGSASVKQVLRGDSVTDAFLQPTASPTVKESTVNVTLQVALVLILAIVNVFSTLKVLRVVNANHCTGTWPKKTLKDVQHATVM